MSRGLAAAALAAILALFSPDPGGANCIPFPCVQCEVQGAGQLNLVVMDRDVGRIRLVPNIRFTGQSPVVAIVIPTPSLPHLAPADKTIWNEVSILTASIRTSSLSSDYVSGCGTAQDASPSSPGLEEDGVVIHSREIVGGFEATIVSSDNSGALVSWLRDNGFAISDGDAGRFAPFVERDWFFTAMKMDTSDTANQMPPDGWDAQVNPIVVDFAADAFELPLPILAINKAGSLPIVAFVIDDHRTTIPGFTTEYANRFSDSEYEAVKRSYPVFAGFLAPGRTLTRLRRNFDDAASMAAPVTVERAATDDEYRQFTQAGDAPDRRGIPGDLLLLGIPAIVYAGRKMRRAPKTR